jgi:hypothetical protein
MRLAPIPIFYHADEELALKASIESSYTTHPGHIAADACAFLSFLIVRALNRGPSTESENIQQFLDRCATEYLKRPELEDQPLMVRLLKSAEPEGSQERCWNWRDPAGPFLLETYQSRGRRYNGYPVDKAYFGAYSMDGLAMAMHSAYHTTSLMAAIEACINLLGDADSTAAICGQIVGAFYGSSALDKNCTELLEQWDNGEISLRAALLAAVGAGRQRRITTVAGGVAGYGHQLLPYDQEENTSEASLLAEKLVQNGNDKYDAKCYDEAASHYKQALEADSSDVKYFANLCDAWISMGDAQYDNVLQTCQQALSKRDEIGATNPKGVSYDKIALLYSHMGHVHAMRREWGLARSAYMSAITLHNREQTRKALIDLEINEQISERSISCETVCEQSM